MLVQISALAGTGRVKAQEAIAGLEWVEAGDVNAPNECAWEGQLAVKTQHGPGPPLRLGDFSGERSKPTRPCT